jgi:DNA-binding transcriptional LysR family regulator
MDTRVVALFAEVARAGSFAAVAKARGVDPSVVSRAIAGLEADLGLRLFERSTRAMRLTEVGDLYLARAAPLVEELERVAAEARQARARPTGLLRLTASVTFGQRRVLPLLPAYRARCPEVELDCRFTDATVDLVAERFDLAVRLAPSVEGAVVAAKLMPTRYRVVAAPAYLAAAPPLDRPGDLSRHAALLFALREFRTHWLFRDAAGHVETVPVRGAVTLSPAGALRDAAIAGLGPALLPDWLVDDDIAAGALVEPLAAWRATATSFDTAAWLVYPSRAFLPAKVRAMIEVLREGLARRPSTRPAGPADEP